jgi:murein DD-endopeptidase MepM/ murein hydrolase activator NlpD
VQSKKLVKFLSLLLSLTFVFCASFGSIGSAFAASTSELKSKKSKIQSQIDSAQEKLDSLSKEKQETEEYISTLDSKIQLLQDKIDVLEEDVDDLQSSIDKIEAKIDSTEKEIEETQAKIDAKQKEFDETFDAYCQRLRAMYVSGSASNIEVLLTSSDISSILTRSQMIKSVSKKDSQTLDSLMKKMEEIEKDKASLEAKRLELKDDKSKLESEKKELQENIESVASSKAELDDEVSEANALMKKLSSQSAEYQEAISSNKDELAQVEKEIQAAYAAASASSGTGSISGSSGSGAYSGTLGYPTSYRTVSAGYPNYSSGRYHGGIDFPCPSGTSVCAAASGTVIVAKNLSYSYGHYLIVDHGNGLSTLYAHNTTLLVSVGDTVSKGQVIALSGSTGNSTGPHCHFEVRVNGTRVNPLNYL